MNMSALLSPSKTAIRAVDLPALESLFDALNDVAYFVKDRDGRYLSVNMTLVRRCGLRSKEEIVGKTALEVHPAPLAHTYMAQDRQVIESGTALSPQPQTIGRPQTLLLALLVDGMVTQNEKGGIHKFSQDIGTIASR